ncbi:hypothetical protein J6590_066457 [Homalodisca vitripennis]|nr:hypothetical protein J6590_066457 [Homalodisca vitripennis]
MASKRYSLQNGCNGNFHSPPSRKYVLVPSGFSSDAIPFPHSDTVNTSAPPATLMVVFTIYLSANTESLERLDGWLSEANECNGASKRRTNNVRRCQIEARHHNYNARPQGQWLIVATPTHLQYTLQQNWAFAENGGIIVDDSMGRATSRPLSALPRNATALWAAVFLVVRIKTVIIYELNKLVQTTKTTLGEATALMQGLVSHVTYGLLRGIVSRPVGASTQVWVSFSRADRAVLSTTRDLRHPPRLHDNRSTIDVKENKAIANPVAWHSSVYWEAIMIKASCKDNEYISQAVTDNSAARARGTRRPSDKRGRSRSHRQFNHNISYLAPIILKFSTMKRIKNLLRVKMGNERFTAPTLRSAYYGKISVILTAPTPNFFPGYVLAEGRTEYEYTQVVFSNNTTNVPKPVEGI